MIRALHSASSGMLAQELNIDTISNNLANVTTTGYKKMRVEFQDCIYQTLRAPGSAVTQTQNSPTGLQVGLGVRPVATTKLFQQGDCERTDNPLDLALEGDGFFVITTCEGAQTAYTRDGSFKVDAQGRLVTSDGNFLQPAITIPPEAMFISVGQDGTVSVTTTDSAEPQVLGQITVARFANPAGLVNTGMNLYQQTAASGPPSIGPAGCNGFGRIVQGYLEGSNVKIVEELVRMIQAQRAFEVNSRAVKAADDMLGEAVNLRR
jgi:flagellar basal-body rod protein FlgG